jgi:pyruvate ferredoxin oxidoreductase delta subunit
VSAQKKTETARQTRLNTRVPVATNFCSNEDWRFEEPKWDKDKCVKCGVCYLFCPDGAVYKDEEGFYEADLEYCKGCGICSVQCWTGCITMEPASERVPWLTR